MKKAIEILEHELSYAKGNRAECNQNDDFYEGWVESLKCAIGVLCSSENASQQSIKADPGVSHKSDEYLWGGEGCKHTA